jgi:hypothetical protein
MRTKQRTKMKLGLDSLTSVVKLRSSKTLALRMDFRTQYSPAQLLFGSLMDATSRDGNSSSISGSKILLRFKETRSWAQRIIGQILNEIYKKKLILKFGNV